MVMNLWRILLYPFTPIYWAVVVVRNKLFDWGVLKSHLIPMPSIGVGNLSVGGTGKSVVIDYLISYLKNNHRVAVLSRGYGRQTTGVVVADVNSTASTIGDEPFQFFSKHKNITVVVAEKRISGIKRLKEMNPTVDLLLLDDVMQHRYVRPSQMILTTSYQAPYFSDSLLPLGNLREVKSGAERADILVVTKCPDKLSDEEMNIFGQSLNLKHHQKLFFTKIKYSATVQNKKNKKPLDELQPSFLLVTGIANPEPLTEYLMSVQLKFDHLTFPDHHFFSLKDIQTIKKMQKGRVILTTEKDFTRLEPLMKDENLFFLPIKMEFLTQTMKTQFDTLLVKKDH